MLFIYLFFFLSFFAVQATDNCHCSVSPASAFAIATAAAGHGSPPGEPSDAREKDF